jgi:hypothetical protein
MSSAEGVRDQVQANATRCAIIGDDHGEKFTDGPDSAQWGSRRGARIRSSRCIACGSQSHSGSCCATQSITAAISIPAKRVAACGSRSFRLSQNRDRNDRWGYGG